MTECFRLAPKGDNWCIMARKDAGAARKAAWVTIGGCPSQIIAKRVYVALTKREGR